MRAEEAKAILEQHNLLSRKVSRKILADIYKNRELDLSLIDNPETRDMIKRLKRRYAEKKQNLKAEARPRNLAFYLMIKEKYPQFNWKEKEDGCIDVDIYYKGLKPSLLSLLLNIVPQLEISEDRTLAENSSAANMEILTACMAAFNREGVTTEIKEEFGGLAKWVRHGQSGNPVVIVSPVCPDYETVAGETHERRFTFNGLGSGVGVAASRLFKSLVGLRQLFEHTLGIRTLVHYVCVGDFEGFSAENCQRLGIDESTFACRIRETSQAIFYSAPVPIVSIPFAQHFCDGRAGWQREIELMEKRFRSNEFGVLHGSRWIRDIAQARKALYDRWYNVHNQSMNFYEDIVIRQGVEYAVMGKLAAESYPNALILGADHHKMAPFYKLSSNLPVLYLSRSYDT